MSAAETPETTSRRMSNDRQHTSDMRAAETPEATIAAAGRVSEGGRTTWTGLDWTGQL